MKKNKIYQLALFGNPVSHSLSPIIHQQFAKQFDLSVNYQLIQVEKKQFFKKVTEFFEAGGHGANVTLPYKSEALNRLNYISELGKISKAINTIYLDDNSQLCGDNTDGIGFINDLNNRCQFDCHNKKILILGAGGATQGIVPAIIQQKPKKLVIANRTLQKAQAICIHKNSKALTLSQLNKLDETFDLIIHTSSLGHYGKCLEYSQQHIHNHTLCYDLSYAKAAQPFINFSKALGVSECFDGYGMLIEQAACSFERWFGLIPSTAKIKLQKAF